MNHIWKVLEFDLVLDSWRFFFSPKPRIDFFYDISLPVLFHIVTWARRSVTSQPPSPVRWDHLRLGFDLVCKPRMEELQCVCVCVIKWLVLDRKDSWTCCCFSVQCWVLSSKCPHGGAIATQTHQLCFSWGLMLLKSVKSSPSTQHCWIVFPVETTFTNW